MILVKKVGIFVLVIITLLSSFTAKASEKEKLQIFKKAIDSVLEGDLINAKELSEKLDKKYTNSAPLQKYLLWLSFLKQSNYFSYYKINNFVKNNPDWPSIHYLKTVAESSLNKKYTNEAILSLFAKSEPYTLKAKMLLLKAMIAKLPENKSITHNSIKKYASQIWLNELMDESTQKEFLQNFGKFLNKNDHEKRVNFLLWNERITQSKPLWRFLSKDYYNLVNARVALMQNDYGVNDQINKVKQNLLNNSGFLYERISWHMRRKNYDNVYEYLKNVNSPQEYPDKWWRVRNIIVRELINQKKFKKAYQISKSHFTTEGTLEFAQSTWLSGWLALQFLDMPEVAYKDFYAMFNNVGTPISKSRAAYWAGRAAAKNGNRDIADNWFVVAAQYPTTFYGQLAHIKKFPNDKLALPKFPTNYANNKGQNKEFDELFIIAKALYDVNDKESSRNFINAAMKVAKDNYEHALLSGIGLAKNDTYFSLKTAKNQHNENITLTKTAYPVLNNIADNRLGDSFILAIIRQESMFRTDAASHVGASGLMQLMPGTARSMARRLRMPFSRGRLATDEAYNVKLGSGYIEMMWESYDKRIVPAIAAYNAGPSNVRKWLNLFGDVTKFDKLEDVIDWIELIPFKETRNYVQRVIENRQVYYSLEHGRKIPILNDLL